MPSPSNFPEVEASTGDPHLCGAWFDLLRRTALPEEAQVDYVLVGPDEAPEQAQLPLLRATPDASLQTAFATFYTPLFAPLGAEHLSRTALTRYFSEIRQQRKITELRLAPLDPEAPFFANARHALKDAGWLTDCYFCFGNWYTDLGTGGFEAYWAQRSSKLRSNVKRARRRLETEPGFSIRIVSGEPGLSAAIDAFVSVYGRSWKQPEPWPRFIPELCTLAAKRGWLRLGLLELNGQSVASQIWLVNDGCAYIVKLAHDSVHDARAVGTVLTAHMVWHVIDIDHVNRIDYLIGDDAYKRNWTPQRRERHGLIAFNPLTLRGLAGAARQFAGRISRPFRTQKE